MSTGFYLSQKREGFCDFSVSDHRGSTGAKRIK
jgi:hypothetical protein